MDEAHDRILDWWDRAYFRDDSLHEGKIPSAGGLKPSGHPVGKNVHLDLEEIFESVCLQRAKLRRDQRAHGMARIGCRALMQGV